MSGYGGTSEAERLRAVHETAADYCDDGDIPRDDSHLVFTAEYGLDFSPCPSCDEWDMP